MRAKIWSKMCSLAYRLHRLNRLSFFACVHYESWRNGAGYSDQPEVRTHSVLKTVSGWLTGMVSSVKEKENGFQSSFTEKDSDIESSWGKGIRHSGANGVLFNPVFLETVESFLCTPNVLPTSQNITKLYNFMVNSNCAFYLKLNVNPKTEKQVLGKLNFKHSRQGTLENLFYGLWPRQKY